MNFALIIHPNIKLSLSIMSRKSCDRELLRITEPGKTPDWSLGNPHLTPSGQHRHVDEISEGSIFKNFGWTIGPHQEFRHHPTEASVIIPLVLVDEIAPKHREALRALCRSNPHLDPDTGFPINSKDLPPHQAGYASEYTY